MKKRNKVLEERISGIGGLARQEFVPNRDLGKRIIKQTIEIMGAEKQKENSEGSGDQERNEMRYLSIAYGENNKYGWMIKYDPKDKDDRKKINRLEYKSRQGELEVRYDGTDKNGAKESVKELIFKKYTRKIIS